MTYHFTKSVEGRFEDVIDRVTTVLSEHGFGVLCRIDVGETLKKKTGTDFRPYVILGACNPNFALEALSHEDKIGTMLPCNVVVQEKDGTPQVSAVDPVESMKAIDNPALRGVAEKVRAELQAVVQGI